MTFSKIAKPASSFTEVRKYPPMYLLNQTGGRLLFQDGLFMNIGKVQQNTYSMVAKPTSSFTKIAKT